MKKFKQIVAAALVAAAVGTAGMTAFAATTASEQFWFDIKAHDDTEFSDYVHKSTAYSVPAHATAQYGASTEKPVYICVCDRTEPEYSNTLTETKELVENYKRVNMAYSRTGIPKPYDDFYLHGTSRDNVYVYGLWEA